MNPSRESAKRLIDFIQVLIDTQPNKVQVLERWARRWVEEDLAATKGGKH